MFKWYNIHLLSSLLSNLLHFLLFPRLIFFFNFATPDPAAVQGGRSRFPGGAARHIAAVAVARQSVEPGSGTAVPVRTAG